MLEKTFKKKWIEFLKPEFQCVDLSSLGDGAPDLLITKGSKFVYCELKIAPRGLEQTQIVFMRDHPDNDKLILTYHNNRDELFIIDNLWDTNYYNMFVSWDRAKLIVKELIG